MNQYAVKHSFWNYIYFMFTFQCWGCVFKVTVCPDILQKLLDFDKNSPAASVWDIHGQNIKVQLRSGESVSW